MADWRTSPRNGGGLSSDEMLDAENTNRVNGLSDKVSLLRGFAMDIENETKESNRYIDGMTGDFSSSEGLLSGSMNRLSNMVGSSKNNRKMMCYIIAGLVSLFVIVYYFISHIAS